MSKTITAKIPAKVGFKGQKIAARTETLHMDDAGRWTLEGFGAVTEAEAIDVLKKSVNWDEIRREHFPMYGFHS